MTSLAAAHPSTFSIFRNRSFTLMWIGSLVSEMGTSLATLASSIYVYQVTGSALNVGLMMMVAVAPSVIVGLVAGVFVDRYDRKRIMIAADLLRAVFFVAIPFLLPVSIAWLYILVMLSAMVGQFFSPAHSSVLPEIASEEELNAANSLMAVSSFGALVVGYALAGFITAGYDIKWVFYIDALTFLVSALCISLIRIQKNKAIGVTSVENVVHNLRAGFRIIGSTPILRSLFLVFFPMFIAIGFSNALRLPFSIQALNATEFEFGLLESLTLIGFVVASLLMARLGDQLREGQWIALSFIGMGITTITFSLLSSVPLALVVIIIEGFVNAPSVIARALVIQRHAPRNARGRVFSSFFVMRDTMFMIGMALAGLADLLDVRLLYMSSGVLTLAMGFLALVLPGLGQPAAEWRRAVRLLRAAPGAPGLGLGHALQTSDYHRLASTFPALTELPDETQKHLRQAMTLYSIPEGTVIVRKGETSDAAYFILYGETVAGFEEGGSYKELGVLRRGDFFGEIAALTGMPRTANVVASRPSTLVKVPANSLREMVSHPQLNRMIMTKMTARMIQSNLIDVASPGRIDQASLRELRTAS
jgi:MFS family permease